MTGLFEGNSLPFVTFLAALGRAVKPVMMKSLSTLVSPASSRGGATCRTSTFRQSVVKLGLHASLSLNLFLSIDIMCMRERGGGESQCADFYTVRVCSVELCSDCVVLLLQRDWS